MMPPATVAEACCHCKEGQPWDKALDDFLHAFYAAADAQARAAMLAEEQPRLDARHDALVGGIAEYLFKRWAPHAPLNWIAAPERTLGLPWFPRAGDDPALMEYLTFASPSEFKSRNIMTDEMPLRRANTPIDPTRTDDPSLRTRRSTSAEAVR